MGLKCKLKRGDTSIVFSSLGMTYSYKGDRWQCLTNYKRARVHKIDMGSCLQRSFCACVWKVFTRVSKMGWIYISWAPSHSLMPNKILQEWKIELSFLTSMMHRKPSTTVRFDAPKEDMSFEAGIVVHVSPCALLLSNEIMSQTWLACVLPGDTHQQEMIPSKKSAVLVDGVVLNGPTTDARAGEKFVQEACRLIMEEVVLKATDVSEKVKIKDIY